MLVMQTIRQQQSQQANQVAMLRDQLVFQSTPNQQDQQQSEGQQAAQQTRQGGGQVSVPVLSDAEIARLTKVLGETYDALKALLSAAANPTP